MLRRLDLGMVLMCLMVLMIVCPDSIFADAAQVKAQAKFNSEALNTEANNIKTFLFSTPIKIAGILGGGYGLIQAMITSSIRPLLIYGGIGLGANIIPIFIDTIF